MTGGADAAAAPRVAILCATYNGAGRLPEQIASWRAQTVTNWHVTFCDDGSTDGTLELTGELAEAEPERFTVVRNRRNLGFCDNFLRNLHLLPDAPFHSFSDQDDIWYPDKVSRACNWLAQIDASVPALYFARTEIVSDDLAPLGLSPRFDHPPAFRNALVQSIGGGNTITFNRAGRGLILAALPRGPVVSHDWWLYILFSGAGGAVRYDREPVLKYRQHGGNLVGANNSGIELAKRFRRAWQGQWKAWNHLHEAALDEVSQVLTEENRAIYATFKRVLHGRRRERMRALRQGGFFRQSALQTRVMQGLIYAGRF